MTRPVSISEIRSQLASMQAAAPLRDASFTLIGNGAVNRPLADRLADLGARRFTLIDPKEYSELSVESQCDPSEVGLPKVDVGAARLQSSRHAPCAVTRVYP